MFGFFRKKSQTQTADDVVTYMREVAPFLSRDGFQLHWLEEIFENDAPLKVGRVFMTLRGRGLSAKGAALAIELATDFYNKQEKRAASVGWPLDEPAGSGYSPRECFFLERLGEAVIAISKRR